MNFDQVIQEKNRIVAIGWTGDYVVYLNVPRDEAIRRYEEHHELKISENSHITVDEFEFNDVFYAYEVSEI